MSEVIEILDSDVDSNSEQYDDDYDMDVTDPSEDDPEYFSYNSLDVEEVKVFLNNAVEQLCSSLQIAPSVAKAILRAYKWDWEKIMNKYLDNENEVLVYSGLIPGVPSAHDVSSINCCGICTNTPPINEYSALPCGHYFCNYCWAEHFGTQVMQGVSSSIQCMAHDCKVIALEEFVLPLITDPQMREKYQQFMFKDQVKSHPQLRFCPGFDCQLFFHALDVSEGARRVECRSCGLMTCFTCGAAHHAPTNCADMRRWLIRCEEDKKTAYYLITNTKCCPKCHTNIEKNGGCNFMYCRVCKNNFCWICLEARGNHKSCSRYVETPDTCNQRREQTAALHKYLHYYERWQNHAKSLELEEKTLACLEARINHKISVGSGTWIDWEYIWDAAKLLKRCRYTLQYTYPCAYYMDGPMKDLFEYQQARLEVEVENLSWKIERAEEVNRSDMVNQMTIAEKRRITLLNYSLNIYSASSS